jgi:hypothetical protein
MAITETVTLLEIIWVIQSVVGIMLNMILLWNAHLDKQVVYGSPGFRRRAHLYLNMNMRTHSANAIMHVAFFALGAYALSLPNPLVSWTSVLAIVVQLVFTLAACDKYLTKRRLLKDGDDDGMRD